MSQEIKKVTKVITQQMRSYENAIKKENIRNNINALDDMFGVSIYIVHLGVEVKFSGFVTAFSDDYSIQSTSNDTYGRMDSIDVYQGTKRKITISWDVPSGSELEAAYNTYKMNLLAKSTYPIYEPSGDNNAVSAGNITTPPLYKVKWTNLLTSTTSSGRGGIVATINGFTFAPDFESGFATVATTQKPDPGMKNFLYPKLYKLSLSLNVKHVHELGFINTNSPNSGWLFNSDYNETQSAPQFPYGLTSGHIRRLAPVVLDDSNRVVSSNSAPTQRRLKAIIIKRQTDTGE